VAGGVTGVEHCRSLSELTRADERAFGGKSAGLGELLMADIEVPPGFALGISAFAAFVGEAGLEGLIAEATAHLTPGNLDAIGAASHAISEAMRFAPFPKSVSDEIHRRYGALGSPPVAVRSSAPGEDSQDATFAGQQETYLWVRGAEHVCDAVRDCWVSLFSTPAIAYRTRLGSQSDAAMAVIVQLMVDARVSGVMFTCNPVSGDPSMVAINSSWGLGLAVVGGEVTPDDFLVSKVTGEVVRRHLHAKHVQYVPDADGRGAVRTAVPEDHRDSPSLTAEQIGDLLQVAKRVERHFGSHQDIEWAIARDGALYLVQSRPVTAVAHRHKPQTESAMSLVMRKFGAG
jgi:pyruvate,water dikinase